MTYPHTGCQCNVQVLLKPGETYSMHVDVKTRDKNVTRVSVSNLFHPDSAKVQDALCQCQLQVFCSYALLPGSVP